MLKQKEARELALPLTGVDGHREVMADSSFAIFSKRLRMQTTGSKDPHTHEKNEGKIRKRNVKE